MPDSQSQSPLSLKPRRFKPLPLILVIGAMAGFVALSSTLAANIDINTGAPIEFGQGVAQTAACDNAITVTPISTFVNGDSGGAFNFSGITLTGLDTTDQAGPSEGCAGKTFTIKIYDDNGDLLDPTYSITVGSSAFTSPDGNTSGNNFGEEFSSVTLTFDSADIAATDVYRITIESAVAEVVVPPTVYTVGETGPGGGIIFYISEAAFTSTGSECNTNCHYLEVAPANWSSHNEEEYYKYSDYELASQTETTGNESGFTWERDSWRIGAGMGNTLLLAAENTASISGNIASKVAQAYPASDSSAGQWFVPSMNELNELCKYANSLPTGSPRTPCSSGTLRSGFSSLWYWSSSEWNEPLDDRKGEFKMYMSFLGGYSMQNVSWLMNLRPIRAL